ncbi:MAG: hypothetical protein AB8B52_03465 [Winogradskyella sp.]|uniref:hypothetical protein n=1 Tax=Winogradskyella sp. TaxID=1883156 RepID=UPI00385C8524
MTTSQILDRIENAKALDFGTIFNQSIELFKKVWVQGLVLLLLNIVLAIPIFMIVYIPIVILGLATAFTLDSTTDFSGSYGGAGMSVILVLFLIVVYLFLIIAMSTLALGLRASFYRICQFKDLNELGKEDYLYFFKKPYLGKTMKLASAVILISVVASMLCFFPLIYAIVPLSFMTVVYAFNPDLSVSDIVKVSFNLGNKKWLISFGLIIISAFLAGIFGFLMCGIGIYITASLSYLPSYFIYKDVVGFDDNNDQLKRIEQLTIE